MSTRRSNFVVVSLTIIGCILICLAQSDSVSIKENAVDDVEIIPDETVDNTDEVVQKVEEPLEDTAVTEIRPTPVTTHKTLADSGNTSRQSSVKEPRQKTSQADTIKPSKKMRRSGIGLNIGSRIFFPDEVNTMIEDIWEEMKSGGITVSEMGTPQIIMAPEIKLKGIVYIVPFLCLEPYGQFLFSVKAMKIRGDISRDANVSLIDFSGGLNCWFKVTPKKRTSFKCGGGGFGGYTILDVSGYAGETKLTGTGFGGNVCTGLDISFTKLSINIDLIVPIGFTEFTHREGDLDIINIGTYPYPSKVKHTGVEIRPGVTFHF